MRDQMTNQRTPRSIQELCRRYRNDDHHACFVSDASADLLHRTQHVHLLPASTVPLVRAIGILHDIGGYLGDAHRHCHGKNIVLEYGLAGFDRHAVGIIAHAIWLQDPCADLRYESSFRELPAYAKDQATRLAAIVAAADGLDASHRQSARIVSVDDTRQRLRLLVDVGDDEIDVDAMGSGVDLWNRVMPRRLRVDRDQGRKSMVRPTDTMQAAAHKVFSRYYEEIVERTPQVQTGCGVVELHQFRVATRRLRAAFRVFRSVFGREVLQPCVDNLRTVAKATNAARDLDVLAESLHRLPSRDGSPSLLEAIRAGRVSGSEETTAVLEGPAFERFRAQVGEFLVEWHPLRRPAVGRIAPRKVCKAAPDLILDRLQAVMAYRDMLPTTSMDVLHDLRLACKRLRYTTDMLSGALSADRKAIVEPMRDLQDALGDVHDADVHAAYVTDHLENCRAQLPADEVAAIEQVVDELGQRRAEAASRFERRWAAFTAASTVTRIEDDFRLMPSWYVMGTPRALSLAVH